MYFSSLNIRQWKGARYIRYQNHNQKLDLNNCGNCASTSAHTNDLDLSPVL